MKGITFLDTIVCLFITGLTVGAANFGINQIHNYKLSAIKLYTQKIAQFLTETQMNAALGSKELKIYKEKTYLLANDTDNFTKSRLMLSNKYKDNLPDNNSAALTFYSNGVSSPATYFTSDETYICRIIISLRSRIRTQCEIYETN